MYQRWAGWVTDRITTILKHLGDIGLKKPTDNRGCISPKRLGRRGPPTTGAA